MQDNAYFGGVWMPVPSRPELNARSATRPVTAFDFFFFIINNIFFWHNKFGNLNVFSELINISVSEACSYLKF